MPRRRSDLFTTIHTEGALLPSELLARIAAGDKTVAGLDPASYHLAPNERLGEAINRSWSRLVGVWASFKEALSKLPPSDPGTTLTRERWLQPLFSELDYGRIKPAGKIEIGGKSYAVSHEWGASPIHMVGARIDIDRRTAGVAGAARQIPHALVQGLLNASDERLWGMVTNGRRLRLLRDNLSLTRQAYVEFDLEAMMDGDVFHDFVVAWLVLHQSRVDAERPELCWLERWTQLAKEQGTRALDALRDGVQHAIEALGRGFLAHPANEALRAALRSGAPDRYGYYRQVLRLVYRFLFLLVAEDRELLHAPDAPESAKDCYWDFYSVTRLRRLAECRRGSPHPDLWRSLRLVMDALGSDAGCSQLGLPALGSFLWSPQAAPALANLDLRNADLLDAMRALSLTSDGKVRRVVDYKNLGAEELGSVYESLLELHPDVNVDARTFALATAGGSERKTTGSYYTPTSLITSLLDSALDPVLAEAAATKPDPQAAILALNVVDPACGSGHFLIAAAHRIAKRLAMARTGDDEPAPDVLRHALRDVIGHCIYGVDLNEMAVELCKVSLWMEALEPGKALSFLEHRIICGNSLLGTTPQLLAQGVPDEAFTVIEGDDKKIVSALKRRNKQERGGQRSFEFGSSPGQAPRPGAAEFDAIDALDDSSVGAVHEKERRYAQAVASPQMQRARLVADAWCSAFVARKTKDAPDVVTEGVLRRLQEAPDRVAPAVRAEVERLANEYKFLHWHLAFPEVFRAPAIGEDDHSGATESGGGFDVVLGNPPWEHVEIKEQEWFASRQPAITEAPNAAARKRMIEALRESDPTLHDQFLADSRRVDAENHLVRESRRFPLCAKGRINTYALFAEHNRALLGPRGRAGFIVPTGIATDDMTKEYFGVLVDGQQLARFLSFENEEFVFPAVHHAFKFALLTVDRSGRSDRADLVFFARQTSDLADPAHHFSLAPADFATLNPNTHTCPTFRSRHDADLNLAIYRHTGVLWREADADGNPWGLRFMQGIFNMAADSGLFRTRADMDARGGRREGNRYDGPDGLHLPLIEAKMVHHFDHRFGTYEGQSEGQANQGKLPELDDTAHADPWRFTLPEYWVAASEVDDRLRDRWSRGWLLGWRDICRSTDQRTVIASLVPRLGVGHTTPLLFADAEPRLVAALYANLCSLVLDYAARQKVGGTHVTYGLLKQFPVLAPATYAGAAPWSPTATLVAWLLPRVLELTCTAWDLEPFAHDVGYEGPPFRWDPERRPILRAELDAAFFHLYGIQRDDVDHIVEAFPVVRKVDERRHGEYRTKRLILERYDAMDQAVKSGQPYQTVLDPPPADPRVAHPPRTAEAARPPAKVLPFRRVQPREQDKYRTCVPLWSLKAAAGAFGAPEPPEFEGWAEVDTRRTLRPGMFLAQVHGHSMEPRIPDGAWCLFTSEVASPSGEVVLVQHVNLQDPETGASFTVKTYQADRVKRGATVRLLPLNHEYQPIELVSTGDASLDLKVVAQLVEVVGAEDATEADRAL